MGVFPKNLAFGMLVYALIPVLLPPFRNWVYFAVCLVLMPAFMPGLAWIALWAGALAKKVTLGGPPEKVGRTVTFVMIQLQALLIGFVGTGGSVPVHHVPTITQQIYGNIFITCTLAWWVLVPVSIVFVHFVKKYLCR
jgi:hypothetical protein